MVIVPRPSPPLPCRPLLTALAAVLLTLLSAPDSHAGGRAGSAGQPKPFAFDRYEPKGIGISIYKPRPLKMHRLPKARRGFHVFSGREPTTGTRFTLYAQRGTRSKAALEGDVAALTGIKASHFIKVLARGAGQGFAWQVGYYGQPRPGQTVSALVMKHGTKPMVFIIVVEVAMGVASRYMNAFTKAYKGLKALP